MNDDVEGVMPLKRTSFSWPMPYTNTSWFKRLALSKLPSPYSISEGLGGLRVCCHWVGLWYIGRINWRSKHITVRFVQMIMARPMTLKHTLSSHTSPKSRVKPPKIWGALNLGKKTFIEGYLNRWNLCPLVTRKPWVP